MQQHPAVGHHLSGGVIQVGIVTDVSIGQLVSINIQLCLEGQFVVRFVSILMAFDMAKGWPPANLGL